MIDSFQELRTLIVDGTMTKKQKTKQRKIFI